MGNIEEENEGKEKIRKNKENKSYGDCLVP